MSVSKKFKKKKTALVKIKKTDSPFILQKEMLFHLEKRINLNLRSYLVLTEAGDPVQIAFAQKRARNDLLKFGPEMNKLAQKIGGLIPETVQDFLESAETLLHFKGFWLDDELISRCHLSRERLEIELQKV